MSNDDWVSTGRQLTGASFTRGLFLLWQAYSFAQDAGAAEWDFALEIATLYNSQLTDNDLRWLIAKGFAFHGEEITCNGDSHRYFLTNRGLNFAKTTCFVLTTVGFDFATRTLGKQHAICNRTIT